uniref:Uncharacterized protein n=1 Tax=Oryza barthii TaxID=65489 RepID=A0A0D3EWY3_9ORYZ
MRCIMNRKRSRTVTSWRSESAQYRAIVFCRGVRMGWRCEKYNASSTVGVPQRRQQLWRLPHTWLLSFSMMKWYRFPQTG